MRLLLAALVLAAQPVPVVTYVSVTAGTATAPDAAVVMPACIPDVFLTLGAGERATTEDCTTPRVFTGAGITTVDGWAELRERNDGVPLGALADALGRMGQCAGADGPNAALAAADSSGHVAEYRDTRLPGVPRARCAVQFVEGEGGTIALHVPKRLHLGTLATEGGILRGTPKRHGLLTLPDVTRLLAPVGVGVRPTPGGDADIEDLDRFANARQRFNGWWVTGLISFPLLLLIALGLRRRVPSWLALAVAAYAPAGFAVSLVPWWRWGRVGTAAAVVATTLALAALGAAVGRRLGSREVGLAAVTAVLFTVDLLTMQQLQRQGLASYSMLTGGRFYGLGNLGFAVYATAVVVLAGAAARRWGPVAWVWALAPLTMVDATAGYDFGGVVALVAAATAALTRRLRAVAVAVAVVAGLGLALGVAYADAQRADPGHLGRFVENGEWSETLGRKGSAALHSLTGTWWPLLVAGCAAGAYVLLKRHPELRPTARVLAVLWVVGSLVNDSGVVVAGAGLALATPLLVSYDARRA